MAPDIPNGKRKIKELNKEKLFYACEMKALQRSVKVFPRLCDLPLGAGGNSRNLGKRLLHLTLLKFVLV